MVERRPEKPNVVVQFHFQEKLRLNKTIHNQIFLFGELYLKEYKLPTF